MVKSLKDLLVKYSRPGGRYAIYPSPHLWKRNFGDSERINGLKESYSSRQGVDIYVHIPFCKNLCTFCGCNIKVTSDRSVESPYLDALLQEWSFYNDVLSDPVINSIHIGGGTPHFFSPEGLQRLLGNILGKKSPNFLGTMEVDPREISREHLEAIREAGFKRIILGVQDFNQDVLKNVNREQPLERVLSVVGQAREIGFEEIVTEWIYGLPLQTSETLGDAMRQLKEIEPEGVAFYPLARVPWQNAGQTAFGSYNLPDIEEKALLYCTGYEELMEQKFQHIGMGYFFQSSSRTYRVFEEGRLGRSMTGLVEERTPILVGLGAGSIGRAGRYLWQNEKVVEKYQYKIFKGKNDMSSFHCQSSEECELETLFEELLCRQECFVERLPISKKLFDDFLKDGILEKTKEGVKTSPLGRHFLKTIFQECDSSFLSA